MNPSVIGVLLLYASSPLFAYENKCTHPKMAVRALDLLADSSQSYSEGRVHESSIRDGETQEDEPAPNVIHHFYDVRTRQGLHVPGLLVGVGPAPHEEFVLELTGLVNAASVDAVSHLKVHLRAAVQRHRDGDTTGAYRSLGRVLHLVQDLAQPGHVHNDPHVPYSGIFTVPFDGLNGGDGSRLEKSVENGCKATQAIAPGTEVPNPLAGLYYPGNSVPTVEDVAEDLARKSYITAAFAGGLALSGSPGSRTGNGSVLVNGRALPVDFVEVDGQRLNRRCDGGPRWLLRDLATENVLCYDPTQPYDGTIVSGFSNDWWEVTDLGSVWAPVPIARRFYFDKYDLIEWAPGMTLTQHFAEVLVPQAINSSAAVLKLFARAIDSRGPSIEVRRTDDNGNLVAAQEVIDVNRVYVKAEDLAALGNPGVTGVFQLELEHLDSSLIFNAAPVVGVSGENPAVRTFANLPDGKYELRAMDGAINITRFRFEVDTNSGPQSKGPKDPPPPSLPPVLPPPNPEIIDASYGQSGQVCAGTSPSGHFVRCARTSGGQENCLPEPQPEACINWACASPGNYDIPIEFNDDRGNWRQTHTIHCVGGNPTVKICKDPDNCVDEPLPPTWNIFRSKMVASVSSGIDYTDLGAPHDCLVEEFIGGGKCQISCLFGDCGITWTKESPATSGSFPLGYQPPAGRHLEPYPFGFNLWLQSIDDPQLTHSLAGFTYPTHGTPPVGVSFPAVGQMQESCNVMQDTCVMTSSAATTAGWGVAPPPTPSTFPASSSMTQAALAQGRALLCGPVSTSVSRLIFGAPTKLRQACDVPSYQPTTGAEACYWNGTSWACGPAANVTCTGSHCVLTADLEHASTWAFLAPLPSSYPDLTAPTLTQLEISENGISWGPGGQVHVSTGASARLTARDPPSGIEVVSGLAANTSPLPFSSLDSATELLFRFDEGSGIQAFDSSPAYATATMSGTAQAWLPGLFGMALDFNGSQSLSVQPDTQLRGQALTIEAWVYPTATSITGGIAGKAAIVNKGLSFGVVGGRLWAQVAGNAQPWNLFADEPLPLNQWSLVAMTFENGTLRLFVNGEQRGQMTAFYEPSGTLVIGNGWKGQIDEFRVLSRAASRAELALDYRRGHAAYFTADGGARWRFAPTADFGGAVEGQPGPYTLTASGLSLSRSTAANIVELAVADVAGHISAASVVIPVSPPDTTRPELSNAQVATDGSTWYQAGSILPPGGASWRATVSDPVAGVALRSGLRISTEPNQPSLVSPTAALWHMDEGSGSISVDSSGNNHELGSLSGLSFVPGRFGTGLRFDGSYASAANRFTVNTWTVSTWVKLESATTGNGLILNKRDDPKQGFALGFSGNQPFLNVGGAGAVEYLTAPTPFAFNTWHYIAGSYDGTTARFYVDGVLVQQKAVPYTADGGGADLGLNNLHGVMDETRIAARAMSADEILAEARGGYGAIFSFDSGRTWSMTAASYDGAAAGAPSGVMTVPGLTLADSTTSNLLVVFAQDDAGNKASATYVLPAGVDTTPPNAPVVVSTSLADGGGVRLTWQPAAGEPPALYKLYREVSPITSVAGLTPVTITTVTALVDAPASGDIYHYALTAQDAQGNVSAASDSTSAEFDRLAPVVNLSIAGSTAAGTGLTYVAPGATFTIAAVDLGVVVSGLTALSASADSMPIAPATAPFFLSAGIHDVAVTAADFSGNLAVFMSSVAVDAGLPISTFSVTGYQQYDSLGRLIVLAGNQLSLLAEDPPAAGVSAGIGGILYRIDGATWTAFTWPVSVPEGQHQVEFKAIDRVGNEEPSRSQAFVVALPGLSGAVVSEAAPDAFRISWSPEPAAAGYVAVVSSAADFSAVSFSTAVEQPEVRVTGLEPASTYYIRLAFFSETNDGLPVTLSAVTLPRLPVNWTGAAGDGLWHTAGNWTPTHVPTILDTATIPSGSTVVVAAGAPVAAFARLELGSGGSAVLRVGSALSGGDLVLNAGAMLVSETTRTLTLGSVDARGGSVLTHAPVSGSIRPVLSLDVTRDMTLTAGAKIDVAGQGHPGTDWRGLGPGFGWEQGGGGGHGGFGGRGAVPVLALTYDDLVSPTQHGSSGGGNRINGSPTAFGGAGGGVALLRVAGTLRLDGLLDASGRDGQGTGLFAFSGGGSGGTVNLRAGMLLGSGVVRANGGSGAHLEPSFTAINGGGGGGRIAVDVTAQDLSSISYEARGGLTGHDDLSSSEPRVGGSGTIYKHTPAQERFDLTLVGPDSDGSIAGTLFQQALHVDTLTVANAVIQWTGGPQEIVVYSSLSLSGQFGITATTFSFPTQGIHSFIIPAGSYLSVTSLSQDPSWDWLVNGRLVVDALRADDFAASGDVQVRDLDVTRLNLISGQVLTERLNVREATELSVPAGALLKAPEFSIPTVPWSIAGTAEFGGVTAAQSLAVTGSLKVSTLTVASGSSMDIPAGASLSADALVFTASAPWSVSGELRLGSRLEVAAFSLHAGGRAGPSKPAAPFELVSNGDVVIDSGALVDARGWGYRDTTGLGAGPGRGCETGGGGGHGGLGGVGEPGSWSCRLSGAQIYGSRTDPRTPGSAGASRGSDVQGGRNSFGGAGGGAVVLKAAGRLSLDGLIDARGGDGISQVFFSRGGGGAGGSVNLSAEVVSGSGTIRAGGGNGSPPQTFAVGEGGGGGGGRVAVVAASADESALSIDVSGGQASRVSASLPMPGDPGTIYRLPVLAVSLDGSAALSSHVEGSSVTSVSTGSAPVPYSVAVFTQGLDPLSPFYEITPSPIVFEPPARFSVTFDPAEVDTNTVAIYYFDGVSWGSATATGQSVEFLASGTARITGLLPHASLYAVMSRDAQAPTLAMTPPSGSTVTTDSPLILLSYADDRSGVSTATLRVALDGTDVTALAVVTDSSATVPLSGLSQGTHTVSAELADRAGNRTSAATDFLVDSRAPETVLLVNGLQASATSLVLISTDSLGFAASDGGTGVLETRYSVDGATEAVFLSTFAVTVGTHTLSFRSLDRAGNAEPAHEVALSVRPPDATAPLLRLDFPGSGGLGVEQAVGGVVAVRGAVSDENALSWTLEVAPGAAATSGFTALASGAGDVLGVLASWDTTALSGYHTLRLSAADAFGNASSITAAVFVGKPAFSFAIGRKDAHVIVNKLRNPTGIAVRSDGLIWVAGTDEDSLLLLTSSGAVVAEVDGDRDHGHGHGHGHGKGKGHDDDDEDMSFKNPQGLALDAADNLFVADKGNNRVLKLSPDGSQVLLQLAKVDGRGRPKPGSEPGELRQPWDVAVDGNGDIYVADSGNRRVQVFDSSGTYLRQFGQGVLLSTSEVRGIALTAEGLWVSDKEQERVFLFSRAGALIKSIGGADSAVGELSRMRGLASDRLGALYVVEPNRDRTQKFDPQGKGLLVFGSKAGLSKADKHAKRYLTQPIDAAIAPDGSIWITDTGRDRIVRYALPVSGGIGVAAAGGETFSSGSIEPARRLVDHRDGAKVERDDGAGVHVPEGALSADLEITVDKGDENQDKDAKRQEKKVAAASEEVQYGPEGTTFNTPVTLVLPYDANLVASQGIKEDELKVYYWNPSLKDWQVMPSVVDRVNKTVSAQTTHFSGYQVQGPGGGIGVAAIDDFGLRDAYAFPNPSRNGSAVTFRIQPGLADSIEVRVYDLSGRKVHSSSDFRFLGAVDDGNGKGAQNTYDHVWGVSGVGSGVYTYVITAKRAGQSDIRKTGKVGVIR